MCTGITVGSVAAVQIVDAVVVDNAMRGVEMTGADGVSPGLDTSTKLRGPWGLNKLIGVKFVGHDRNCPACPHSWRPYFSPAEGNPKSQKWGDARLGLVCPAWFGLNVENCTFIKCGADPNTGLALPRAARMRCPWCALKGVCLLAACCRSATTGQG